MRRAGGWVFGVCLMLACEGSGPKPTTPAGGDPTPFATDSAPTASAAAPTPTRHAPTPTRPGSTPTRPGPTGPAATPSPAGSTRTPVAPSPPSPTATARPVTPSARPSTPTVAVDTPSTTSAPTPSPRPATSRPPDPTPTDPGPTDPSTAPPGSPPAPTPCEGPACGDGAGIRGVAFVDLDLDGARGVDERGVVGLDVGLEEDGDCDGAGDTDGASTATDITGAYTFGGLEPGCYVVVVRADALPSGVALEGGVDLRVRVPLEAGEEAEVDLGLWADVAPPPPHLPAELPEALAAALPQTPEGRPILLQTAMPGFNGVALALVYDTSVDDPTARWAGCLSRVAACRLANPGPIAGCVELIERCETSAGGAGCCPEGCIGAFREALGAGASEREAVRQSFEAGACVDGYVQQRDAARAVLRAEGVLP